MKFVLPMPPSINRTYGVNRTGSDPMYKKAKAVEWEETAGWHLKTQWKGKRESLIGNVRVGIIWFYKYDRDIDAGLKILFDLLQRQQVIINDRQIRKITNVDMVQDKLRPRVEIVIEEFN